ncbi:hypothetical protein, partial [Gluconobacter oxydans]
GRVVLILLPRMTRLSVSSAKTLHHTSIKGITSVLLNQGVWRGVHIFNPMKTFLSQVKHWLALYREHASGLQG